MKIPKRFKRLGDDKLCHLVGVVDDGDIQVITYKQWIPCKRYWVYKAMEGGQLHRELYYKRYGKFPTIKVQIPPKP